MSVTVPDVIGKGRLEAEAALEAKLLRYIARFPFAGDGDGRATTQSPPAATLVPAFTVVTVSYPSPMGPLPDTGVQGPTLPPSTYEGMIKSVLVGKPYGSGQGAWISFETQMDGGPVSFTGVLYFDQAASPSNLLERAEWMRRGAMLGAAQRALTHGHKVRLVTASDVFIVSIEIFA